ncbi:RTA1 like protein-domain-containing protein [Cadophora sp. MPI-SDFR-AT-0126]|nr:RTA1 like protein-domain-containing protein [Leotiomycetes sp. MPI-SDFR-AT-0126]
MPGSNTDDCESVSPSCPVSDTIYGYTPTLGGNAFYAVVFAICALVQCYYIWRFWRSWKTYSILTFIGCVGECCGYIGRLFLHKNPWNGAALPIQLVLLMVSPSFLAAALYTTLRALVRHFGPEHTRLPERFWTWPFVTADLVGFFLQCGGGVVSAAGENNASLASVGNAIMIFGVSFQAVIMILAGIATTDFALRIGRRHGAGVYADLPNDLKTFLLGMTAAFFLILTRCIYRIPELAGGVGGRLMQQEVEFMMFDGALILLSAVILCIVHPGIFAKALQDSRAHEYEMKASSVPDDRCGTHDVECGAGQRGHGLEARNGEFYLYPGSRVE